MRALRFGSACSGIEAASVAWSRLGWSCAWVSEIEPFPCAVLANRHPRVPNLGDMTAADFVEKARQRGSIDLFVAGTPCQDYSVAGERAGMDGDRGQLTLRYLAIADGLRPGWLVWENVPGVLSSNGGRDFGRFLFQLGELGYGWAYRVLDAQYFGLAQRRKRVFVVACAGGDWRRAAAVLFERGCLSGHPAPSRDAGAVTSALTARGPGCGGAGADDNTAQANHLISEETSHCLTGSASRLDPNGETLIAHTLRAEGFDASEDGTGRGTPLVPIAFHGTQSPAWNEELTPAMGTNPSGELCVAAFQECQSGLHEDDVAGTLRSNGPGHDPVGTRVRVQMAVRRLTPRECERLQGFPDDYTLIPWRGGQKRKGRDRVETYNAIIAAGHSPEEAQKLIDTPDGPRYRALGNSKAVPVVEWIGRRIGIVAAMREVVA